MNNNIIDIIYNNDKIIYINNYELLYDNDEVIGINIDNQTYYYIKDETGNIISLIEDGKEVTRYIYDAFGNIEVYGIDNSGNLYINNNSSFIGNINPIRYKSYYYDIESNLYYLNTRYYEASIGRFISPDSIDYIDPSIINGLNLYCYCNNNPVMYSDPEGTFAITTLVLVTIGIVALLATINDVYQIFRENDNVEYKNITDSNVEINNSYKILTPWMRYGYSFYLNYINDETKDVIKGTSLGVEFEWRIHNVAYYTGKIAKFIGVKKIFGESIDEFIEKSATVDIGASIFEDHHGVESGIMHLLYLISNPFGAIHDLLLYWWRKKHEEK